MPRSPVTISLNDEILTEIDSVKGKNEPRSRFIEDIISDFLVKSEGKNPSVKVPKTTKSRTAS